MLKKLILFLGLLLVVAQFIRLPKNRTNRPQPDDLFALQPASEEVRRAIEHSCYDCHSNNTRYPWYAEIQPLGWWLANHIKNGKENLNFSEFGRYSPKRAVRKLAQASEQIGDDAMPLPSYTLVHRDARFTADQKKRIEQWLDAIQERIEEAP